MIRSHPLSPEEQKTSASPAATTITSSSLPLHPPPVTTTSPQTEDTTTENEGAEHDIPVTKPPSSPTTLSAAEILGEGSLKRASIVRISPSNPESPHPPAISMPLQDLDNVKKAKNKSLWQKLVESTPGTDAHLKKYGYRFTMGPSRTIYGRDYRHHP